MRSHFSRDKLHLPKRIKCKGRPKGAALTVIGKRKRKGTGGGQGQRAKKAKVSPVSAASDQDQDQDVLLKGSSEPYVVIAGPPQLVKSKCRCL